MRWINCVEKLPPKDGTKFLFHYDYGTGIGQYGECYRTINGNSERGNLAYALVLHPLEIIEGDDPFIWDDKQMIRMNVNWMPLPCPPEKKE